ncbi:MAG TPA: Ig-like domain-containing protein, partial [Thermoanaerobaculia bacterium]|nr:Ig-like domain-containing protein [Thermoanaerobaculia bacterium]
MANASGKPAWPTPFSAAQRFGSVEGRGAARLVFTDDLTVGADPGVVNDRASIVLDAEARLLLKADAPQIALTASPDGGNVTTGQPLSVSYTLSDPLGLFARVATFTPSGAVTAVFADEPVTVSSGVLPLQVPANQPPGPVTYSLQVRDRAGRTQSVSRSWTVLPDAPPVLNLTGVTPGPSVLPGAVIAATANATDDVGLTSVVFTLSGAVTASDPRPVAGLSSAQAFSTRLPTTLTAGQTVTLQVDAADTFGHKTSAAPVTWTILADTAPPSIAPVAISPVKAGDVYTTGDVVTFTVTATDNVAVAAIRLTIDGVTTPFAGSPAVLTWTAPNVGGSTPYTLDVEALDVAGNRATASRAVSVVPAGGGTFPMVSFACPTAGAFLPSAYAGLLLSAAATDAGGVTKIEFFRPGDVTPFSTSTATGAPVSYTGTSTAVTLPTVAADTVVRYRARAWNPSNHFTEVFVDVHVVPAVDFASATATDFAVLRSGTAVVDAPKTFAGLIVLRGATITHTAATGPGGERAASLTVAGPMYVECGASVDVSGRGYGSTTTYP